MDGHRTVINSAMANQDRAIGESLARVRAAECRANDRREAFEAAVSAYYASHHGHDPRKMVRAVIDAYERALNV